MIVAGPEGFSKTHYRTFNIRSEDLTPGDDFGMMREVLLRRFARLMKEAPRAEARQRRAPRPRRRRRRRMPAWPDLVAHRRRHAGSSRPRARRWTSSASSDVPLVGVAKGRTATPGGKRSSCRAASRSSSPPRDPALYFIQRLRDEAHRFAIGTHRAKRKRESRRARWTRSGIGPARKRALLLHFGTAKAIARASLDDLAKAPGVNPATARAVYDFFHEGR